VNRRRSSPAPGRDTGIDLPNRAQEVKFQLSAKTLLWVSVFGDRGDLLLGYTQSSRWQLYQADISCPFHETNYEPELLLNFMLGGDVPGWRVRTAGLSLNHQSNGRTMPLSCKWNRVMAHVRLERDGWSLVLRPWLRLGESSDDDDNPDILDHIDRGDLTISRELSDGGGLSLRLRHSLRGGDASRGAAELEWAFPLYGCLQGYVQAFTSYGESPIDYNHRQNRIGLGLSLAGWHRVRVRQAARCAPARLQGPSAVTPGRSWSLRCSSRCGNATRSPCRVKA
jgi:phospholipase A1